MDKKILDGLIKAQDFIEAVQLKGISLNNSIDSRLFAILNSTDLENNFDIFKSDDFQEDWVVFLNFIVDSKETESLDMTFTVRAHAHLSKNGFFLFSYGGRNARLACATSDNKTSEVIIPHGADRFFSLINGLPVMALLRCPYCKKIFLNISKRKMIYCSANCRTYASIKRTKEK